LLVTNGRALAGGATVAIAVAELIDGNNNLRSGEAPVDYDFIEIPGDVDPLAYSIQGLETGVTYYVRISAGNDRGFGDASIDVPATPVSVPGFVPRILLSGLNSQLLRVQFDNNPDDGGDMVDCFLVEWATDPLFYAE